MLLCSKPYATTSISRKRRTPPQRSKNKSRLKVSHRETLQSDNTHVDSVVTHFSQFEYTKRLCFRTDPYQKYLCLLSFVHVNGCVIRYTP